MFRVILTVNSKYYAKQYQQANHDGQVNFS